MESCASSESVEYAYADGLRFRNFMATMCGLYGVSFESQAACNPYHVHCESLQRLDLV